MRFPWANTILLTAVSLQAITGYLGFTSGLESERWLLWLHGIGAYVIVVLLFWKGAIILDVYGRTQRWTARRLVFTFMALLLLITLLSGLLWTFYGPLHLLGFSFISLHIFLAVLLIALVVWHIVAYRWILRRSVARDRRAFLRFTVLGAVGLTGWAIATRVKRTLVLPGALRRFTGSYEVGSFSSNFPSVSWINDDPASIDPAGWQLTVSGAVRRPQSLSYEQLLELPGANGVFILDCTGGWYSEQSWQGISLVTLLTLAEVLPEARSVTFESITGYRRRFSLDRSDHILLATSVAGEALSHGHGFPLRLVVPRERGVNWVKWLTRIHLNVSSHHWQSPLPLQ